MISTRDLAGFGLFLCVKSFSCTESGDQTLAGDFVPGPEMEVLGLGANGVAMLELFPVQFRVLEAFSLDSGASVITVVTSLEKKGSMLWKI